MFKGIRTARWLVVCLMLVGGVSQAVEPASGAGMEQAVLDGSRSVPEVVSAIRKAIEARGLKVIATIDHGGAANGVDMSLRPTVLLVFGNPKAGTPLMQARQLSGLELPLKLLVFEDGAGRVRLAWPSSAELARRLAVEPNHAFVVKVTGLYEGLSKEMAVP